MSNESFTLTSTAPYDRHRYKIWCTDDTVKIVDSYDEVLTAWWNFPQYCRIVEVIDQKSKGGGFA